MVGRLMHSVDMANKQMFSNRIDTDLTDALKAEAAAEHRSVANMLELVLRERYSVLTEREDRGLGESRAFGQKAASPVGLETQTERKPAPAGPGTVAQVDSSRSVSADRPVAHDVHAAARQLASRNGKCGADVARGTKCKLCGKVH
jgi:hypothetical protein